MAASDCQPQQVADQQTEHGSGHVCPCGAEVCCRRCPPQTPEQGSTALATARPAAIVRAAGWLVGVSAGLWAAAIGAQSPSDLAPPPERPPMRLYTHSWTAERPVEVRQVRLHDLVTVIVSEQSMVTSEGEMDRKKKAEGSMTLQDWILLRGLTAIPDPQSAGDPTIKGKMENKLRSEAELETRDAMKFRIACTVVDIRPNGNLVLEGHRIIKNNNETWEYALTGEIRAEDVLPNNTVLSENVAYLRIDKRESGHVRDGYRRGWLLRFLDTWQPF